MVSKFFNALFFVFQLQLVIAQTKLDRPKLVVGIVVDQMKQDYLYKFYDKYGEHGFKKMLREGFSCENLHYNYSPTVTGPGHASIFTGTTPAFHGIIGNDWHERYSREGMYCVEDKAVKTVGDGRPATGEKSPINLLASTITDELRLFFNHRSKVIGLSIKDRGAILPAGHNPTGAYWFDESTGNFVTSTYYMNTLPKWVSDFNTAKWCDKLLAKGWSTLLPIDQYTESFPDDNPYEGKLSGEKLPTFPRTFSGRSMANITNSPHGNTLITELGIQAIEGEMMGQDDITDFLALSYSSPDYAGHLFGLQSVEIEDIYLRLDVEMERLINYLDEKVGKNEYILFLSADHAVAHVPQLLKDHKYAADYFKSWNMMDTIKKTLTKKYDQYIIDGSSNYQIYLNEDRILFKKYNRDAILKDIMTMVRKYPGVVEVFQRENIPYLSHNHPIYDKIRLGFHAVRGGDIIYYVLPAWMDRPTKTGTTHGSPYTYDTHVPALFYGWNIPAGKSYIQYGISDIAPTISHLIKIPMPNASIGKVIEFVK